MKEVTIGLGYICLATSALIAQNASRIRGVDINLNLERYNKIIKVTNLYGLGRAFEKIVSFLHNKCFNS